MIFNALFDAAKRGELLLIDGGICNWHLRKDGQLTIRDIISTRKGAGKEMLNYLLLVPNVNSIFAKCPQDLESNSWYEKQGFILEGSESTKSGNKLNLWRLIVKKG